MAQKIHIARAWCDIHLAQCYQSHDEQTGVNKHLGDKDSMRPAGTAELGAELERLKALGYIARHRSGVYTLTLRMSAPLIPLPVEWTMAQESKEPEYIEDW